MISTVIVTGTRAPKLISNVLVTRMTQGNLLLEIATADHPTYRMHDSVLWAVNMSGSMLDTSSTALINATQPYARPLADGMPRGLSTVPLATALA
jgi:alanine dehydrogenase